MTLYQMLFLERIPNYACVNEAANIAKNIYQNNSEPLTKFVNGVLHTLIKDIKAKKDYTPNQDDLPTYLSVKYSHPLWMVKRILSQYGQYRTEKILNANNTRPRLTIRVNQLVTSAINVSKEFTDNKIPIFFNLTKTNCIVIDGRFEVVRELDI